MTELLSLILSFQLKKIIMCQLIYNKCDINCSFLWHIPLTYKTSHSRSDIRHLLDTQSGNYYSSSA